MGMGILNKIRRALEKREISALKKKINRLEIEATKQGKTVASLAIVLDTRSGSLSNRFEFVLSDGTTNKQHQKPNKTGANRVVPVKESPIDTPPLKESGLQQPTLVGKSLDYDEKSAWVEDYDEAGVKISLIVRRDGIKDLLKVRCCGKGSVAQCAIWWIENEEKVRQKFNVTATPPAKAPLILFRVILKN